MEAAQHQLLDVFSFTELLKLNSVAMHETHNPQIWKNWGNAVCILADQVSITSQNRNILSSAYSDVQVAAPCSNSFQSSTLHAWNLDFLGRG
jgi:hypothetical protein